MAHRIDGWLRRLCGLHDAAAPAAPEIALGAVHGNVRRRPWLSYLVSLTLVVAITLTGLQIEHQLTSTNLAMVYLLAVVVSALRWGLLPAVVTAVTSTLIFTYFFIPPYRSFAFRDDWYLITFVTFLVVGLIISRLASEATQNARRAAALAIERAKLQEKAQQAYWTEERNRLHKALMNSVSHNLRTPLASISGALNSLIEDGPALSESIRNELLESALEQSVALNRLVGNLLDVTRLEAGALRLRIEPCEVQDLVGSALAQLGSAISSRRISVDIPPDLPLFYMDFVLVSQVLVNLVDNALRYSPADRPVEIRARIEDGRLRVDVADRGIGIESGDLIRIFEKFHRAGNAANSNGIGLGLYICKRFVEAHGGRIWAERRAQAGTLVTFEIPRLGEFGSLPVPYSGSPEELTVS